MRFPRAFHALASLLLLLPAPAPAAAQAAGEWNDARTADLVERAIDRRSMEVVDTALQTYRADARGFVYFLLDAPELDRQSLVRTDQVALEVYWRSPNEIRQRIVGWREQRELPITRLHYYLDRLTVVQDNYGESIVIADGDNVRDVPHPVAAGGLGFYDYRLADSLTLRLPGLEDPVVVHEVQARPKDVTLPGIVGSVFLESASGALVRMAFTFTPAAYVDPRLDYINVTLENGLWGGRFWLPHEQRLEIRREMPELDLPFGTLIRTRMRISDYRFNEPLSDLLFASRTPVTFAPPAKRESFPFEEPIDAGWRAEGIGQPADVAEIRREARELVRVQAISGLSRRRLGFGSASDLFRYNRAEGAAVGFGWGSRMGSTSARVHGGWAFGPDHPTARVDLGFGDADRATFSGYVNRALDAGGELPASRAANTLGTLFFATDWLDPFYASGGSGSARIPIGAGEYSLGGTVRVERQRSARLTQTFSLFGAPDDLRPVRPIDDGTHLSAGVSIRRDVGSVTRARWGELRAAMGSLERDDATALRFGRAEVEAGATWSASRRRAAVDLLATGGMLFGEAPRQELFLHGGRGLLPGYDFRAFGGDRAAVARVVAAADITHPWLRGRLSGSLGWVGVGEAGRRAATLWEVSGTEGVRGSAGVGVGLFYDLLRVDVVRGLSTGGRTQLIVEFQPDFWDFL